MAKHSNESDVWKSCKRLDDGKRALCEICGENCPVEAVQHLRSGNTCVYCTRRRPLVAQRVQKKRLYKRHENSVILIKQSLYDWFTSFLEHYTCHNVILQKPINHWPLNTLLITYYLLTYLLKSNPGNPVPVTGYPVPKLVPTSNHYYSKANKVSNSERTIDKLNKRIIFKSVLVLFRNKMSKLVPAFWNHSLPNLAHFPVTQCTIPQSDDRGHDRPPISCLQHVLQLIQLVTLV